MRTGRPVEGRPFRWMVLHRCGDHGDLLPSELSGRPAQAREHALLSERRRSAASRFPGLQAVPADTSPGSPEWNHRADVVARAMRLIADGVVDREGVPGLAGRLGYSTRQIERQLNAELGAGPLALARAQRAQTARLLIETTPLPMGDVAFAAGFASIRAFNDTVRDVFALSPTGLRERVAKGHPPRARERSPCGCRSVRHSARITCSAISRPPPSQASRSGGTARSAALCAYPTDTASRPFALSPTTSPAR